MKHKEPCGCIADERQWLEMCPPCKVEFTALHKRAQLEHKGQRTSKAPASPTDWLEIPNS